MGARSSKIALAISHQFYYVNISVVLIITESCVSRNFDFCLHLLYINKYKAIA